MKLEAYKEILEGLSKRQIKFKDTLEVKDLAVVLFGEDNKLHFYFVYIISIERDFSKKDEWWFVTFLFINPVVIEHTPVTWILRTEQMTGQEVYTMNDVPHVFLPLDLMPKPKPKLTVVK